MRKKHEELFSLSFAVTFPMVVGFVVAVRMVVDGIGRTSLVMLGMWIAATCFLWTLPRILPRMGVKRETVTDERGILVYANSALVAHAATWLFLISAAALACWHVGESGTVSANALPAILVGGAVVFQVVFACSEYVQEKTRLWPVKS